MTHKEQDAAENIIREIRDRQARRDRIVAIVGLASFGVMSLWVLVEAVAYVAYRLGGGDDPAV